MKKTISLLIILALGSWFLGPNLGVAEEFDTRMAESEEELIGAEGEGEGEPVEEETTMAAPVVKAFWAMNNSAADLSGTDDSQDSEAQFLPSGQYQASKPVSVCAVVSDASGITDIDSVSAEINYPMISFGEIAEDERTGCGQQMGSGCQMSQLTKEDGLELFCQAIQENNTNLPSFYDIYDYSSICGLEGELEQETAAVFCCDRELLYNDIAGEYGVLVSAKDKGELESNVLEGSFYYLEVTAFEADFTAIDYGEVVLNSKKVIEGDLIWNDPKGENSLTVKNVGNTRLQLDIWQDDMEIGKTEGEWNIRYGARIGQESEWQNYWPEETTLLDKIMELSAIDSLDLSVEVFEFPGDEIKNYGGKMNLNAQRAEYLVCETE